MKGEQRVDIEYPDGRFTEVVIRFLEYKRSLGYKYADSTMYTLRQILVTMNKSAGSGIALTKELVLSINELRPGENPGSRQARTSLLRQLAKYMLAQGYDAYVLPDNFIKYEKTVFKAFIFTENEIEAVIETCDSWCQSSKRLMKNTRIVYPFLLRTLYGCALRVSEVVKLKECDVCLEQRWIYIDKSKNKKSRYVPIDESLAKCLETYERLKRESGIVSLDGSYFTAKDGYMYSKSAVKAKVKDFIVQAGVRKTSEGKAPRVHDLRHTAAVRILETLDERGLDMNEYLPLLSYFLGHATIWETEQYLQLPEHSFGRLSELKAICDLIPEVDDV